MVCKCLLFGLVILILITGCMRQRYPDLAYVDTANLYELESVRSAPLLPSDTGSRYTNLRTKLLRDSALMIGAQGGLAFASEQMNGHMNDDRKYLDTIFNFNGLMLSHGVIPPVLEVGDNTLNLDDPNTIR